MNLSEIIILVWDDLANFDSPATKRQFGNGNLYKDVFQFHSSDEFEKALGKVGDNDKVIVCCHVKYEDLSGYLDFKYAGIIQNYMIDDIVYLSSGHSGEVMKKIYEMTNASEPVFLYSELIKGIQTLDIKPTTKRKIKSEETLQLSLHEDDNQGNVYPQVDYAIITALYEAEFEEIKIFIDFPSTERIRTETTIFHIGYLKADRNVQVVAGIPSATGMVDAAILATQMLEFFRPKYLLMSGVCAGVPKLNFGDIVVGKQFFTFQKGKISDIYTKTGEEDTPLLGVFDRKGRSIDLDHLFDKDGNRISVNVEKFEPEHDSIIELDSLVKAEIEINREDIQIKINEHLKSYEKQIQIVIEPIACSSMVINKKGYFEDFVKPLHRKTVAIEMESYAIARTCMFANNKKTKAVIFKSVMDKMGDDGPKGDKEKRFAAHTSARFLNHLLTDVLKK